MTIPNLLPNHARHHGFTLVELMIAMTVGLLLLSGMVTALVGSSSMGKTRERSSVVQFSGRYAIDTMKRDLQHAGYLGITSLFAPDAPVPFAVSNVCDAATVGQLSLRVWGADSNPYAGSCIPADKYLTGDVLMVRRLSISPVTGPFSSNVIYYHSSYEGGTAFLGPTAPDFNGTNRQPPYLDYALEETVYYVSPYTTSPSESPRVPALYRMRLTNGPAMVPELVATGVEQMQLRYGQFDSSGNGRYVEAASITDWDSITSIEISLLVRADAVEPGYRNTSTYSVGGEDIVVNDSYRRTVFTTVVQMRN